MLNLRELRQRLMGCLGASLLAHTAAGAALVMAPAMMSTQPQELPTAVYIESNEGMSKGEQLESLPAAGATKETESIKAETAQPGDITPVAAQPDPQKEAKSSKNEVAKTLPQKKAKSAPKAAAIKPVVQEPAPLETQEEGDLSVASAVAAARNAKTENFESLPVEEPKVDEMKEEASNEPAPMPIVVTPQEEPKEAEEQFEATEPTQSAVTAPVPVESEKPAPKAEAAVAAPESAKVATAEQASAKPAAGMAKALPAAQSPNQNQGSGSVMGQGGAGSSKPYGIRNADELRAAPGNRPPEYPERDRLMRNQGNVVFVARVLPDGTVTDVQMEKGTQSKSLDVSALNAMKNWRFLPGQAGWVRKGFTFSLGGEAQEMPARLRR